MLTLRNMGARLTAPVKCALGRPQGEEGAASRTPGWKLYATLCALPALALVALVALALLAGGYATRASAQAPATSTPATSAPAKAASPAAAASPSVTTTQAAGTPTPPPTPSGPPPAPEDMLTFFGSPTGGLLVKRDYLQLDKDDSLEILFTLTGPSDVVTGENHSDLGVIDYDPTYREWKLGWNSSTDTALGLASPLPAANRADGYNGGDLLHTGSPIFLLRTTTLDGRAHLHMWKWDINKQSAEPLKMAPVGGGSEREEFEADLDVTVADLDNDGVYEVVADNLSSAQVWKWDGSKYAPEVKP